MSGWQRATDETGGTDDSGYGDDGGDDDDGGDGPDGRSGDLRDLDVRGRERPM